MTTRTHMKDSPYRALKAAGLAIEHHESDLYVRATAEAQRIVKKSGWGHKTFWSNRPPVGELWLDVPFAYDPWWKKRMR